jgi:hypothetical protein
MSQLDNSTTTSSPRALDQLATLLLDGSLKRAQEQKTLGSALAQTKQRIVDTDLPAKLAAIIPAVDVVAPHLRHRAEVAHALRQIYGISAALQDAQTRDDLEKVRMNLQDSAHHRTTVERDVREAWEVWIDLEFQKIKALGELLTRVSDTRSVGEQLRVGAPRGLALRSSFPPTQDQVSRAQTLIAHHETLLHDLRQQAALVDLLAFLDRVMDGHATLEHVTPKLLEWLVANKAIGLLRIHL